MDLASASTSEVPTPDGRLPACPVGAHPRHSAVAEAGPQPSLRETPRSGLLAASRGLPGPHRLRADSPTLPLHVTWVCRRGAQEPALSRSRAPWSWAAPSPQHLLSQSARGRHRTLRQPVLCQVTGSRLPTVGPRHVTGDADTPNWKTVPSQSPAPPFPPRSSTE